ncbi:MAG: hypothetical protein ACT4PL_14660 [Phycisphaerales bacterium]
MSISVGQVKLRDAYKALRMRTERARAEWDDDARREFDRMYLDGLEAKVLTAIAGVSRLQEILAQARRECE